MDSLPAEPQGKPIVKAGYYEFSLTFVWTKSLLSFLKGVFVWILSILKRRLEPLASPNKRTTEPTSGAWKMVGQPQGTTHEPRPHFRIFSSVQLLSRVQLFAISWLQHARSRCPSPTPGACLNSCPLSWWCHPTISPLSARPLPLPPSIFPSIRVFSSESVLRIRWSKYCSFSFSISPSNEYSGLISFRMDWLDLLAVQGTLKSLTLHHSSKASILWRSAFFIVQFTSIYDHWRNHSLD